MQVDAIVPADCGEAAISAFWAWLGAAGDAPIPPEHIPAFRTLFTKLNMYCNPGCNSNLGVGFDRHVSGAETLLCRPGCYANASGFEDVDEIAMLQMEAADFGFDAHRRTRALQCRVCRVDWYALITTAQYMICYHNHIFFVSTRPAHT
jgi:hypothetical protein